MSFRMLLQNLACTLLLSLMLSELVAAAPKQQTFDEWIGRLKNQAFSQGISEDTIRRMFEAVKPMDFQSLAAQQTGNNFLARALDASHQAYAKKLLSYYADILFEVQHLFGVEPAALAALWTIQNDLSETKQSWPAISVLANRSFQEQSNPIWQNELIYALKIVDQAQITADQLTSDLDGRLGTLYLKPSSFRDYVIDYDGNSRYDIWTSHADIFASMANYLSSLGWTSNRPWGLEVKAPGNLPAKYFSLNMQQSIDKWHELRLSTADGMELPEMEYFSSLVKINTLPTRYFLVFDNFYALMRWERSTDFAIAVGLMIDYLKPASSQNPAEPIPANTSLPESNTTQQTLQ